MSSSAREEIRQRTYDALVDAGIKVLSEEGIQRLTAAKVASVAQVSRRTFFNYFPHIEGLLVAVAESATAEIVQILLARPHYEPLHDSLKGALATLLDSQTFDRVELLGRAAVAEPHMKRLMLAVVDSQTAALEEGLWQRLGPEADPAYVAALAAASAAVFGRMIRIAAETVEPTAADAKARQREWVRRAFDHLYAGFDESGAYPDRAH